MASVCYKGYSMSSMGSRQLVVSRRRNKVLSVLSRCRRFFFGVLLEVSDPAVLCVSLADMKPVNDPAEQYGQLFVERSQAVPALKPRWQCRCDLFTLHDDFRPRSFSLYCAQGAVRPHADRGWFWMLHDPAEMSTQNPLTRCGYLTASIL